MMGLLRDVGKIGVPDAAINKLGRLNEEEYAKIITPASEYFFSNLKNVNLPE